MRTKKRSVLLRAPGLVVLLTLLLATTGLVYAHWTATLDLNGNVNTGSVVMAWSQAWTNDDGVLNASDGEPTTNEIFDAWGTASSADPSDHVAPAPGRYTKDVAKCTAAHTDDLVTWTIENAYPSYNCTLTATLKNTGSVPVRATSIAFTATRTPDGGSPGSIPIVPGINEGNFYLGTTHQIEGDISAGVRCGTQIDPAESVTTSGWLHVLQPALQNATYAFALSQDFVNWNEWDVTMCTAGAVVDQDGDPTTADLCYWNGLACVTPLP
ncbi:MAG: hypothetical protein GWP04_01030 [Gammaproteobacteria bacterium]|nr:hypothetical protein [Gammaproteobacteria bacterium]